MQHNFSTITIFFWDERKGNKTAATDPRFKCIYNTQSPFSPNKMSPSSLKFVDKCRWKNKKNPKKLYLQL